MVRLIIFIFFFTLIHTVNGQKNSFAKARPRTWTQKAMDEEERNHNCIKKKYTSLTSRLKRYPFNVSSKIQFASFEGDFYLLDKEIIQQDSFPRINDRMLYSKLTEVKTLTYLEVDKLTDIFYNYGFRGSIHVNIETACYNPRNAILFLDNNGEIVDFIEICFECHKARTSSDKISLGDMCDQKLNMLFDLFKKVGIEYSITGIKPD
ncbi:hypothetical protein [Arcicella rigui]|uniref:Uncharacterized protein n=1 Tax=Arcicella rigui TaxID=797020 RepID=A0ABU5QCY0_9BACT|nr:hypothetical protein [Arcicella rigui]MEA5140706.1 hypothetical protein [Arcicella rigui]